MFRTTALQRMALAGALTTGVGGAATTAVPGLDHWPAASVIVVVAVITAVSGVLRKLLHAALIAVIATGALLVADTATGGNIQRDLNLSTLLGLQTAPHNGKD
ncbi:Uncharacterised protein [Mycobacteroides abscessus subsp. abscessus]|uniref:hypothetical protein n=1 Tax=Mycobacteroides abscessus TaxID=36809 RepID=UPI0009258E3F|nr:hypothetical protein [Mycobacteroides abscessus]SIM05145.1 Uncharacterised protein [Mycobacteroides abscessus subsp. abscessus]SLC77590.1 Uncharacterised protein [Mycobacteroides abscessus subsp. abscessus]